MPLPSTRRACRRGNARAAARNVMENHPRDNDSNVVRRRSERARRADGLQRARAGGPAAQALREVRWWRRANNFESQAIRAGLRGHRARSRRMFPALGQDDPCARGRRVGGRSGTSRP